MKTDDWQKIKEVFNASLDLPEAERAPFLAKYDENLRREVEKLINANKEAENFIIEPAFIEVGFTDDSETDFYIGKQIDEYKILEEIGHGGMGTVYLAVKADESFDKKFAIKLIKRGMDTNAVLKRFVMERKILAQLENPNIASLIDGGSTTDGLPYLVMEYIEGEPITKFCDSHQFSIEERLELFRKVCSAISYAHQNLVVHRDIKPSNILVTKDGTPKLLDFGIAKLLHPDWSLETDEATATMFRLMTPEYASPEQIRGLPITTASDVYSLGVVLYELLSGERPYKIESRLLQEVANVILTEEPVRPSAVTKKEGETGREGDRETKSNNSPTPPLPFSLSQLRGDLDNIILKALRKEPERRYQTVQEFSEDIRRHLVGLPVTATADTTFYRVGKFVKRHRIGVFVGILFALTLISATAITTWQAVVAKRERAKAEQHFNQVRKLANTVLFDYHDDVAKLAGSTPLREKMVKDALEYLDNLSAENIADKDLQLELAAAYEKIGDVQGNPYSANLGNEDGALDSYKKALVIRQTLFLANPADDKIKFELGNSFNNVGDILWAKGENEDALSNYRQGLQLFEELSKSDSQNPKYFSGINYSLAGIAHVQTQLGDSKGALETYRRNLTSAETVLALNPTKESQRGVAIANLKLGDALMDVGDYQVALENYQTSVSTFSELVSADKDNATKIRELCLGYSRIAIVYNRLSQFADAAEFNLKAIEEQKRIAAADPQNVQIFLDIATTYQNLAGNYLELNKLDVALENSRESIKIFTETLAKNPNNSQAQGNFGGAYITLAEILTEKGDLNGALETYQKALHLLESESIRSSQMRSLAYTYQGIAEVYQKNKHFDEAKTWYQKSLAVWEDLQNKGQITSEYSAKSDEIKQLIEQCETRRK